MASLGRALWPRSVRSAARQARLFSTARFRSPETYRLYLVTDDPYLDDQFYGKVEASIRGGVTCVQLRLKDVSSAVYVEWGLKIRELTRRYNVPMIVDDRLDVALAVEADGLHVGGDDLPWAMARHLLGPERILGCSTYGRPDLVERALAPEVRADYLGSGAIFATPTKRSSSAKGLGHLPELRKHVDAQVAGRYVPIVAIGGVDASSAADCVRQGVDGVAVVRGLLQTASPAQSEGAAKAIAAEVQGALQEAGRLSEDGAK
mmetsp:Transcript_53915/g.101054  ORF Transcript_53915/g.101054 Transcript_53915/m.101054 type:complete len:262 (-) Transcript_53915:4-789(-)